MSDTTASLRRKISSAGELQSVVRTMKALAASSIGQYEKSVSALGDYNRTVEMGLGLCFRKSGLAAPITAAKGRTDEKSVGAVVFGCDQGLEAHRAKGEYAQLFVFHNRPQSGALYEPVSQRLLPLDAPWAQGLAKIPWPTKPLPEVMGGGTTTLRALVREYLFISLFRACAESLASENASRLAAMQRADKNIDDLLETLHGTFHRLRQSGIDEELFDVISGFEALSKEIARRSSMSRQ
jgi:F0F1-type ATP synthase gamma subunit